MHIITFGTRIIAQERITHVHGKILRQFRIIMFRPNRKENPALAERTINDHGYAVAGTRKQLIYILQLLQYFVVFFQNKFTDFKPRHGFRRTAQSPIILHAIALSYMRKILFEYPRKTLTIIPIAFVFHLRKFLRRRHHALCHLFGIVKHAFPPNQRPLRQATTSVRS